MSDPNTVDADPFTIPPPPAPAQVLAAKKAVVVLLLDETSSMMRIAKETVDSVNAFFATLLRENDPEAVQVGAWTFSEVAGEPSTRTLFSTRKLASWQRMTYEQYRPRGYTPLYDAIGLVITQADYILDGLKKLDQEDRRVVIVIQTDGEENRSKEISLVALKSMIADRQKRGWEFVFLGADLENTHEIGQRIGTQSANTMQYDTRMSASVAQATASNASDFIKGAKHDASYTVGQRQAFERPTKRS